MKPEVTRILVTLGLLIAVIVCRARCGQAGALLLHAVDGPSPAPSLRPIPPGVNDGGARHDFR